MPMRDTSKRRRLPVARAAPSDRAVRVPRTRRPSPAPAQPRVLLSSAVLSRVKIRLSWIENSQSVRINEAPARIELACRTREALGDSPARFRVQRLIAEPRLVEIEDYHPEAFALRRDEQVVQIEIGMVQARAQHLFYRFACAFENLAAHAGRVISAHKFAKPHAGERSADEEAGIQAWPDPANPRTHRLGQRHSPPYRFDRHRELHERARTKSDVKIIEQQTHRPAAACAAHE